jgi:asparagine synthase (glutamine-hydrolysing)
MPGIVGVVTKMPREQALAELKEMVAALRHETFYVTGTWEDPAAGIYVGWVAREKSFCAEMPVHNERKDVTLIFSGEEFPHPDLIQGLIRRGHSVDPEGPSYLAHLYEDDASTFPSGLNGRFHGVVFDRNRGTSVLFNDRYGMHRLYYHQSSEAFYFAGEAKAILAVQPGLREFDPRGIGEYLSCGCVLENRTLFKGISLLPPASSWSFAGGTLERKGQYFHPREWEEQSTLDPEAYYRELREVFSRNLPRYFRGPERIGMSLTGGLDCRMILAWQKPAPGDLPCFTFGDGTGFRQCQDAIIAGRVAAVCRQPHQLIPVGPGFLPRFSHYAERTVYLSDGCVDLTYSPDLHLNEIARQIAPARMTGNYGSEVLRSSVAFRASAPAPGLFSQELIAQANVAAETYSEIARGNALSFGVFRQAPWHHYGLLGLEQTQLNLRTPYLDNDLVRTVFRAPAAALSNDVCLRLIADGDDGLSRIRTDRGLQVRNGGLVASARRDALEFLFKAEYAYDSGMPQWLARIDHALKPLRLEQLFLGWHKFHHFRIWYRRELAGYVREMLLDRRSLSRPHIDPRQLQAVVEGHLKGNRNHTFEIHQTLTLELLHRVFLDRR